MNQLFNMSLPEHFESSLKAEGLDIFAKITTTKNLQGNSPLHVFTLKNTYLLIQRILELANKYSIIVNLDIQNKSGNTPLHITNNNNLIKLLLKYGASPFIPNNNGEMVYTKNKLIKEHIHSKFI